MRTRYTGTDSAWRDRVCPIQEVETDQWNVTSAQAKMSEEERVEAARVGLAPALDRVVQVPLLVSGIGARVLRLGLGLG